MTTHYPSKSFHFLLLALVLGMANSVVHAEKADFDKPTNVEANQMSNLGNVLGDFGEPFGPKNLMDVVKMTGLDAIVIKKLMAMAS